MTDLLKAAFEAANAKLTEPEQDWLAVAILAEVNEDEDREWAEKFAATLPQLEHLADQALAEHRAGSDATPRARSSLSIRSSFPRQPKRSG